jgi:pyruvate, water dikinase
MMHFTCLQGLFDGIKISRSQIERRRKCHAAAGISGSMMLFAHEDAGKIAAEFTSLGKASSVTGLVASAGMAKGRAIVAPAITNPDVVRQLDSMMKKGDILIAHSTTPEFMPLCSKAAAIVTDQGGMLSHAAIVARELKVPCIIGTGSATRLFSNGDIILVDAEKGIARNVGK